MLLKFSIATLCLVVLAGCSVNYKNTTDYKLCYSHATLPSYNIHTDNREAEIRSRGLDCRPYADRIDEEERAKNLVEAGATRITNKTTVQQPIKKKEEIIMCHTFGNYTICD